MKRWYTAALGYAVFSVGYLFTGRYHAGTPILIPPLTPDRAIPFLSGSVWIYNSQFVFLAWTIATMKDPAKLFRAMALASLAAFSVFFFFPTEIARDFVPGAGLTGDSFRFLYSLDTPANCFPSLHVALAAIAAENRRGPVATLWAGLIIVSTLTTKQHYFIDVAGGLVLAAIAQSVSAASTRFSSALARTISSPESA